MIEPGWTSFNAAAHRIRERLACGWAEAKVRIRGACGAGLIGSMKAPCNSEPLPREFWTEIAHREWREREVDQDGPDADGCEIEVMLNEDDFKRWLSGEVKPERRPKSIRLTKRNTSREAIEFLWPAGIPDGLANQDIVKRVSDRLKEEGLTVPSPDTILRAAERKH